jgi:hypothetical protein
VWNPELSQMRTERAASNHAVELIVAHVKAGQLRLTRVDNVARQCILIHAIQLHFGYDIENAKVICKTKTKQQQQKKMYAKVRSFGCVPNAAGIVPI